LVVWGKRCRLVFHLKLKSMNLQQQFKVRNDEKEKYFYFDAQTDGELLTKKCRCYGKTKNWQQTLYKK